MSLTRHAGERTYNPTSLLWVCILACAVQNLDANLVSIIYPQFSAAFAGSAKGGQAVLDLAASIFPLALAAVILGAGRLGDLHGRKRMLYVGLIIEMAALLGAVVAPSPAVMVLVRLVGGAGAALVSVLTLAIVNAGIADPKRRARAITTFVMMLGLGPVLLPILVQLINETGTSAWRYTFFVPFLMGAASLALLPRFVPESRSEGSSRMDWLGTGLAALGLFTLILGVSRATLPGGFASPGCWGPILVGVVTLAALALRSRGREEAVLPMDLFAKPLFAGGVFLAVVMYTSYVGFTFQLNNYLQQVRHIAPLNAVLWVAPVGIGFIVAGLLETPLERRAGRRPVMAGGLALTALAIVAATLVLDARTPYAAMIAPMIAAGGGFLLANASRTNAVLSVAPPARSGTASGTTNAANNVGIGCGVAISNVILSSRLVPQLRGALERAGVAEAKVSHVLAVLKAQLASLGHDHQIVSESGLSLHEILKLDALGVSAYLGALHVTLLVLAGILAAGILIVAFVMRPSPSAGAPAVAGGVGAGGVAAAGAAHEAGAAAADAPETAGTDA